MFNRSFNVAAGLLLALVLLWLSRSWFEADPISHMLFQYPLLVLAGVIGYLQVWLLPQRFHHHPFCHGGWTPLLVAFFTLLFWMIPLHIDAAVNNPLADAVKFVTLPLLVGWLGALGWQLAHPLLHGFIKAQTVSMLLFQAFLYTHAPIRLCLSYLANQQLWLGYGFLGVAIGCAIIFTYPLLFPKVSHDHAL